MEAELEPIANASVDDDIAGIYICYTSSPPRFNIIHCYGRSKCCVAIFRYLNYSKSKHRLFCSTAPPNALEHLVKVLSKLAESLLEIE